MKNAPLVAGNIVAALHADAPKHAGRLFPSGVKRSAEEGATSSEHLPPCGGAGWVLRELIGHGEFFLPCLNRTLTTDGMYGGVLWPVPDATLPP
ncbi:hypothetical protein [Deinococcus hopiensis]|uniref:Uncharacterized protein n=1 Tax=Deinococcus hopiensis KR-140 TaxID=695939 RepID=A0A1W1VQ69_9DEIO|nr:hypothetical protein [Deinococcus hopiensis]SMB95413.1 hypothetical protein SAMN00790413_02825 [Deinococcus hopiensis KR-140]